MKRIHTLLWKSRIVQILTYHLRFGSLLCYLQVKKLSNHPDDHLYDHMKIHRKQIRIHQDPNYAFGNQPSYPQDPTITWKWYDLETNGITNKETRLGIEARKITSSDNPSVMISLVLSIFTTPKPNVIPFPLEVSILNTSSVTSSYTFSIPLENISYVT